MKNLRSWLAFHEQAFKHSLSFLWRERWSTAMTVMVIAMALMLSSLFWVLTDNVSRLTADWQRSGHISLYLDASLSSADEMSLLERVQKTLGVGEATLKTPEQGLAALQTQEGMQDIMRYLPENPLPAVIDVTPAATLNSAAEIKQLYQTLQTYPHVEQAKLDMEWVSRLFAFLNVVSTLAHMLMLMLALAVVLIIGNTLRLIIQDRHEEMTVLRLVGACDAFIMRPFLYSGVCYGAMAALLAIICVDLFIFSLDSGINQLFASYQMHYTLSGMSFSQMCLLMILAITLGWLGARFSVMRYIRSSG